MPNKFDRLKYLPCILLRNGRLNICLNIYQQRRKLLFHILMILYEPLFELTMFSTTYVPLANPQRPPDIAWKQRLSRVHIQHSAARLLLDGSPKYSPRPFHNIPVSAHSRPGFLTALSPMGFSGDTLASLDPPDWRFLGARQYKRTDHKLRRPHWQAWVHLGKSRLRHAQKVHHVASAGSVFVSVFAVAVVDVVVPV